MTMKISEAEVRQIVSEVLLRLRDQLPFDGESAGISLGDGVFATVEEAVNAANDAYRKMGKLSLAQREQIIRKMREISLAHAEELAEMAVRETGLGRARDKIQKNRLAAEKTPGVEDLEPRTFTGDKGLTLVEHAPLGIIGAITPMTNPAATIINNGISMVAAGNAVVFNPHPNAKQVSIHAMKLLNRAIVSAGGPENLLTCVANPTIETSEQIMRHPRVNALVVTGGGAVVRAALASGKKVIAAGPGNPPVIVDETADLAQAGRDIVLGASFDNNILCTAEKELFVVESVVQSLKEEMLRNGAFEIRGTQLDKLMELTLVRREGSNVWLPNKDWVGKDAARLLEAIGIRAKEDVRLIIAETPEDHPLVVTEMLMPVLPIVRVPNVDAAIHAAVRAEKGNRHTAVMHTRDIRHATKAAQMLGTVIFVLNGPSYAGLGMGAEGFTSLTIAGPTGEGLTSARTFTRKRHCALVDAFRIL